MDSILDSINEILHDPDVYPDVSLGMKDIDAVDIVKKSFPVWFDGGGFFFTPLCGDETHAEVHTALLPRVRGRVALDYARQAKNIAFIDGPFTHLFTRVKHDNRKANMFTRWNGFVEYASDESFRYYKYDIYEWIASNEEFEEIGLNLIRKIRATEYKGIFPRALGAFISMLRCNKPEKAFIIYNRIASLISAPQAVLGYDEIVFDGAHISLDLVFEV